MTEPCSCCGESDGVTRKVRDIGGQITTTFCPRCDQRKCEVCGEVVEFWLRSHCGQAL